MPGTIYCGDAVACLRRLPDNSVHAVVTSPPYFCQRDYQNPAQLGLEPTPPEYVAALTAVFGEVRRVLRNDGTLWLNVGDSYNAAGRKGQGTRKGCKQGTNRAAAAGHDTARPNDPRLKEKDLLGVPWRLAFALQDAGWYLRADIIWYKTNCMPDSVKDRPTKAHEYLFLLSKSARYHYDRVAGSEPTAAAPPGREASPGRRSKKRPEPTLFDAVADAADPGGDTRRNRRTVWAVPTRPYRGAHFATFPVELVAPCVRIGCPAGGVVLDPFFGSGTTGVAALDAGRSFVGIELNPEYAELARKRLCRLHGPACVTVTAG